MPPNPSPAVEVRHKIQIRHKHPAASAVPQSATQLASLSPLPKLDVFPTPQPLTPEERAFVVLITQTPTPVRNALLAAQEQDDAPVHIAAIHIPPLESHNHDQP